MLLIIFLLSNKASFNKTDLEILGVAISKAREELKEKKEKNDTDEFILSLKRIDKLLNDFHANTHLEELRKKAIERKIINDRIIEELERIKKPKPSEPDIFIGI